MAEAATAVQTARAGFEEALKANPYDAAAHVRWAQLEAKIWGQTPQEADLGGLVRHLDLALVNLPTQNHPQVLSFAAELQKGGADVAGIVKSGSHPRLLALLTRRPLPQGIPESAPEQSRPPSQPPAGQATAQEQPNAEPETLAPQVAAGAPGSFSAP